MNLSIIIQSIIDEWQLKDKIVLVVSDNAANIKGAISTLELTHFGCFAHSLNLIVQEALKTQSNLINTVKTIVGHFKRSSNANHQLMLYQENSGATPKKLLNDSHTLEYTFHLLTFLILILLF